MVIYADTAEMREMSGELHQIRTELENYMNEIETVVLSIGTEWQGNAERAYTAQLIFLRRQFNGMIRFLEEYAGLLESFSSDYETYDRELSSKICLA